MPAGRPKGSKNKPGDTNKPVTEASNVVSMTSKGIKKQEEKEIKKKQKEIEKAQKAAAKLKDKQN